jgi:hypothetical protein
VTGRKRRLNCSRVFFFFLSFLLTSWHAAPTGCGLRGTAEVLASCAAAGLARSAAAIAIARKALLIVIFVVVRGRRSFSVKRSREFSCVEDGVLKKRSVRRERRVLIASWQEGGKKGRARAGFCVRRSTTPIDDVARPASISPALRLLLPSVPPSLP